MARYWYNWNGTSNDQVTGSYNSPTPIKPSCSGGAFACSVYVYSGGTNPDPGTLTDNILSYLTIAKQNSFAFYPLVGTPFVGSRSTS